MVIGRIIILANVTYFPLTNDKPQSSSIALANGIKGSANLTQRVVDEKQGPIINVAVIPKISPSEYHPEYRPTHLTCRIDRYYVTRISDSHAVALLEGLA